MLDEPLWLTRLAVEAIHTDLIRAHGGEVGLRDEGALESALARARHRWCYDPSSDLVSLASCHGYALTRSHPFVDGNKRIAFVAMNVFLILNGLEIETTEEDVVDVMYRLAAGAIDEGALAEWLRRVTVPAPPG